MSYQVLARKWRPQVFQQMVGQEHVLKALTNALDQDRLHHAYLFTGTRGVGKTTVARIFAKCLNCEEGVSAVPCGVCSACTDLANGRFVDLIEIDAASRTKVEDMRELLENVQYSPTRGRFKVYLIDEVHMLSNSSFNALLKTLEEPPPHIKFLLATTDPHKLPVTILSRCLQFNLKNMSPERIMQHLKHVLDEESIHYEEAALWLLARSAEGSMRDALSLADQAIAYGEAELREGEVAEMLGTIDRRFVQQIAQCLAGDNPKDLLDAVQVISTFSPDYAAILQELQSLFHRISVEQVVPGHQDNSFGDLELVRHLATSLRPEDVQLYYQIATMGRKELPLAPDSRTGFEMSLLRMLAFTPDRPASTGAESDPVSTSASPPVAADNPSSGREEGVQAAQTRDTVAEPTAASVLPGSDNVAEDLQHEQDTNAPRPNPNPSSDWQEEGKKKAVAPGLDAPGGEETSDSLSPVSNSENVGRQSATPATENQDLAVYDQMLDAAPEHGEADSLREPANEPQNESLPDGESGEKIKPLPVPDENPPLLRGKGWIEIVENLNLSGMTQSLAMRLSLEAVEGDQVRFLTDKNHFDFFNENHIYRIEHALSSHCGEDMRIDIKVGESRFHNPYEYQDAQRRIRQQHAETSMKADPNVTTLISVFDGELLVDSIKPLTEE